VFYKIVKGSLIEEIATLVIVLKPEKNQAENFLTHGVACEGLGYI
jgi:hypothetical protein